MLKLITLPPEDAAGRLLIEVFHPEDGLTKTASGELWGETRRYLDSLSGKTGKVYVLVNALGAGEYYGANINTDYFPEDQLNPSDPNAGYGYKTFLNAGIYRHHKNKDPSKSMGRIAFVTYNPVMHRVELVLEIDRQRAAELGHGDLLESIDLGKKLAVSMGCKVPYDQCSICGHLSKTTADHCAHIKDTRGKIYSDGRKAYMVNIKPKFFDLSFVVIGADRTSYAMAKVAFAQSHLFTENSAVLANEYRIRDGALVGELKEKLAKKQKLSEVLKRVPAMSAKVMPALTRREPDLPSGLLARMSSASVPSALTTATAAGIVLKPAEFQKVILVCLGKAPLAESLQRQGLVFRATSGLDRSLSWGSPSLYSPSLSRMLVPHIPQRSMFSEPLTKRIIVIKKSASQPIPRPVEKNDALLEKVSAAYNGYREQLFEKISGVVANITGSDIKLLAEIGDFGFEDSLVGLYQPGGVGGGSLTKEASALPMALLGAIPLAYLYGAYQEGSGREPGGLLGMVRKHPILTASVLAGLTRVGAHLNKTGVLDKAIKQIAS